MNIEIKRNFYLDIFGLADIARNKDYAGTAWRLSGKLWEIVKANDLRNNGMNIWVYESGEKVFTGVELENNSGTNISELEKKAINLEKYAYYKHVGAYNLIKQVGQAMTDQLTVQGFEVILPYIEIYGHWTADQTKSETELLMSLV